MAANAIEKLTDFMDRVDDVMETRIVQTNEQLDAAVAEMKAKGKELAVQSNAGLPHGSWRLTFRPADAFIKPAAAM